MTFVDVLVQKDVIAPEKANAIDRNAQGDVTALEEALTQAGVSTEDIRNAKAEYYNLPAREVDGDVVNKDILRYVSEDSVRHYKFVPIDLKDDVLEVGIVDPENVEARDALQFISTKLDLPFKMFAITNDDFQKMLGGYESLSGEVRQALSQLESEVASEREIGKLSEELSKVEVGERSETETELVEEAPIIKIVATILRHAIEQDASDVHIEPMSDSIRVRFRVDGVLRTNLKLPLTVHSAIVARIKLVTNMRLDERRKPQDGRFSTHLFDRTIDFRVSTFPTYYDEKIVIRILDPRKGVFELEKLGLPEHNIKMIRRAIKQPYGMVLISGPTGSGKTSTLYAMLQEVDREGKNVLSLEDPIEYSVEGVSQSQVRPEIGYTFATGLRTTLRQDPDVIMVGEIRDAETASLAVQAALTGHLVLSTIHTNDAVGIVSRLLDMGIDPYLIPPTVILGIAQRLVRTLCPDSKKEVPIDESTRLILEEAVENFPKERQKKVREAKSMYEPVPTDDCPAGTKGRTAVFEMFEMSGEMEQVILTNPVDPEIEKVARKQGMLKMREDAIIKALDGVISFAEVNTLGTIAESMDLEEENSEDEALEGRTVASESIDLENADMELPENDT